jgi:protein-glutamine gamma-glutamyltransferase
MKITCDCSPATPHNPTLRFFQVLIYVLTGIGFSMLVLAAQISTAISVIFVLFYAASFRLNVSLKFCLSHCQGKLLTWAYLPIFILDTFVFSRSFIPATLHLILFVQLVKIYQPKQDRDYFYLLILSFLQVLAASSLTIDLPFLILFVAYIFVCLSVLITFEIKRSSERAGRHTLRNEQGTEGSTQSQGLFLIRSRPPALKSVGMVSAASLVIILLIGAVLFFAIPRFGSGYFHRVARRSSVLSGFSDTIRLGSIGMIQLDRGVVMRVRVAGDSSLLKNARWRGVTLDHFDGRTWSKRTGGATVSYPFGRDFRLNPDSGPGTRVSYQVLLEPSPASYLFTVDRITRLQGNLSPVSRDPSDDTVMARPHPFRRLAYQAESLLFRSEEAYLSHPGLPRTEQQAYLQLPSLDARILELALRLSANATGIEGKARNIERYLQRNFSYSLDPPQLQSPQPLTAFLLESKRGHCEYFASSMVVLLRNLGISARIVNGFQAGEYNDIAGDYIVRGSDAHSWVEVLVPEKGWRAFDPTPPTHPSGARHPLLTTFNNYLDAFELLWTEWVIGYDDVMQVSLFRDLQEKTSRWTAKGRRGFSERMIVFQQRLRSLVALGMAYPSQSVTGVLLSLLTLAVATVLLTTGFRRARRPYGLRRPLRSGRSCLPVRFYGECLDFLRAQGKGKPPHLTPSEFAAAFPANGIGAQVRELTRIYNLARFGGEAIQELEIRRAHQLLREIRLRCREPERLP